MAWTEADRVKIRHYLGFAAIFLQADPRLESAITAVQSVADGGARPDNSTELHIRQILAKLAKVEEELEKLWPQMQAGVIDELKVDAVRATVMLRSEGRRLVHGLAAALSTSPRRDVFSPSPPEIR